ncbi:MAG: hypothetical protein ACTHJS_19620 [Xanthobacteraceae bacterium]
MLIATPIGERFDAIEDISCARMLNLIQIKKGIRIASSATVTNEWQHSQLWVKKGDMRRSAEAGVVRRAR